MMTNLELQTLLDERLMAFNMLVWDDEYALPSREWVLGDFSLALKKNLELVGASLYLETRNDCDDFARLAWALAGLCHNLTTRKPCALAFGVLTYKQDSGGGHAINFAVVHDDKGEREIMFYEPQTQQEVFLSESERNNTMSYIV